VTRLWFAVIATCVAPAANAQTGVPAVDSAAVARAAWREAVRAATPAATLPHLAHAARAWPGQPAYWSAMAVIAAQASDTAHLLESLTMLGGLGAGAAAIADTAVVRMSTAPGVADAVRRIKGATSDVVAGSVFRTSPDSTIFAEGVDADGGSGRLYVASIRHRTVYSVGPDGTWHDLALYRAPRIGAVLGVRVARGGKSLWVTTVGLPQMRDYTAADSSLAALLLVRAADGTIERRWDLPDDGALHVLGDLAVGPAGDVFMTDSRQPVLYRLRPGADTLETTRHPLFRSLQGAAATPDGRFLYVADYSHGLLRIELRTGAVVRLTDAPGTTSLGVDGLVLDRQSLIGVQNGLSPARIARFTLTPDGAGVSRVDVLDRQPGVADEPTIGTLLDGGYLYVANSQWEKYDDAGQRRDGTRLAPTHLIRIPLSP
jgi:sugar lactone lactonase YvrE